MFLDMHLHTQQDTHILTLCFLRYDKGTFECSPPQAIQFWLYLTAIYFSASSGRNLTWLENKEMFNFYL